MVCRIFIYLPRWSMVESYRRDFSMGNNDPALSPPGINDQFMSCCLYVCLRRPVMERYCRGYYNPFYFIIITRLLNAYIFSHSLSIIRHHTNSRCMINIDPSIRIALIISWSVCRWSSVIISFRACSMLK